MWLLAANRVPINGEEVVVENCSPKYGITSFCGENDSVSLGSVRFGAFDGFCFYLFLNH